MFNAGELLLPENATQNPAANAQLALRKAIPRKKFALSAQIDNEYLLLGFLEDFLNKDMSQQQKTPSLYHQWYSIPDDALSAADAGVQTMAQPSRDLAESLDVLIMEHRRIFVAGDAQFRLAHEQNGAIIEQFPIDSAKSIALPVKTWEVTSDHQVGFFTELSQINSQQRTEYLDRLKGHEALGRYNLYIYQDGDWQLLGNLEEVAEHSVSNLNNGILLEDRGGYRWDIMHSYHVRSDTLQRFMDGDSQQSEDTTTLDYNFTQWQMRDIANYSYFFALNNQSPFNSDSNIAAKVRVESKVAVDAVSLFSQYSISPDSGRIETIDQSFERIRSVRSLSEDENFEGRKIGAAFDHQLSYPIYAYEEFDLRTDSNTHTYYHVITGISDAATIQEYYDSWASMNVKHYSMDYTTNSGNEYYVEVLDNKIIHVRRHPETQFNASFSALVYDVMTIDQVYESAIDWASQDEGVMMDFTAGYDGLPTSLFWLTVDEQPHFKTGKVQIRNFQILN